MMNVQKMVSKEEGCSRLKEREKENFNVFIYNVEKKNGI